jgi:hypothetical protein
MKAWKVVGGVDVAIDIEEIKEAAYDAGVADERARCVAIVDAMASIAARGDLAGDYARGWRVAADEAQARIKAKA